MGAANQSQSDSTEALLRVVNLSKRYVRGGYLSRKRIEVEGLIRVNLEISRGSTLAVIGASGSGKSTLARCLAGLEEPSSGDIWFAGKNLASLDGHEQVLFHRQVQLIFQDPALSLNPRLRAVEIVSEPLHIAGLGTRQERLKRSLDLMEVVGLPAGWGSRFPPEFSGGQRQRLAIARALALEPRLLILDEAFAGLDLSTQAQIVNLLLDLQASRSLTYVWISHDLGLITHLADEVEVLHQGRIVEFSRNLDLMASPRTLPAQELVRASLAFQTP